MAVFLPFKPDSFNSSFAEESVFESLSLLSDDYFVLHSVRWINDGVDLKTKSQGEADFVIFNPNLGLLVIEVKGGELRYKDRQWFQTNRSTLKEKEIQDPEVQASASKFFILEKVKVIVPRSESCLVCHCVWFPDIIFSQKKLPLNYSQDIVLDARSLNTPSKNIEEVFQFWSNKLFTTKLSSNTIPKIIETLAPIFRLTKSLRTEFEKLNNQFIRLTNQQCRVIEFLDEQKTAAISGVAGTGKTVVAIEKAKALLAQNEKVTFLCYNSALKNYLQNSISTNGLKFYTFHSLAAHYVRSGSFDETASAFLQLLSEDDSEISFDNLIIDEGQDFESDWLEWLQLRTKGVFYVFYDPNQLIFLDDIPRWFNKLDCRLVLKRICRNTKQITTTALKFIDSNFSIIPSTADGPKPILHQIINDKDFIRDVSQLIKKLIKTQKYDPHDIAILTMETFNLQILRDFSKNFEYDINEEIKKNSICVTSVRKFKGLEARVIILTDINLEKSNQNEWGNRLYVGCTRAMQELHLFITKCDEKYYSVSVNQITGKKKLVADENKFAKLLESNWSQEESQ